MSFGLRLPNYNRYPPPTSRWLWWVVWALVLVLALLYVRGSWV